MRATGPKKPRHSLRARAIGLLLLAVAAAVSPEALAQSTRDIAGGPMGTRTFERLLQAFLQPTDEESRILDRLHERYLDRFRAEIDPELAAFMDRSMSDEIAAERPEARLQRQLRDVERITTRIAELDNAFFNGALEVLSEPSRAGFARVRAARERQRLLSGMSRFAPMALGAGTAIVDLVDVVARPRYMDGLAPEARTQLVSFLAAQESRLLAQVRVVHGESARALLEWYGLSSAISELQGALDDGQAGDGKDDAVPADPDTNGGAVAAPPDRGADRARQLIDQMRELGKSMRKAIRANHTDNRAAAGQLADILGKPRADQLRVELALRALVDALRESWYALEVFVGDPYEGSGVHRDSVARIRRDPLLTDEQRVEIDALVASWDAERAPLLERMVEQVDEHGRSDMLAEYGYTSRGTDSPDAVASERLEQEWDGAVSRAQSMNERLYAGIAEVLGARAVVYLSRRGGSDAPLEEIPDGAALANAAPGPWEPRAPDPTDDVDTQWSSGSAWPSDDTPISSDILREVLQICGREEAWDLAGEIHNSWRFEKWTPRFDELGAQLSKAQSDCYRVVGEGQLVLDRAAQARCREVERAMRDARIELEETLFADLAGGLGIDVGGPESTLLRLALADRIADGALSIPRALVLAAATTDEVSAMLAATPEAWRDAVARLREALRRRGVLMAEESELQDTDWGTVDEAARTRLGQRMSALAKERMELSAATVRMLVECFDGALAVAITSPERAAEFRRARRQVTHAEIYAPAQSAERALAAAAALPDLDEETRARLEALQAEYLAVYDTMSERMVALSTMVEGGVDAPIDWTDYSKRMQEYERIDFDRRERREKAIGELRRLLGSARAARIPGLGDDAPRGPGDRSGGSWDGGGLFDDE